MTTSRSRGPTLAKNINRKLIYASLKKSRTATRAELAAKLHLNKNTVNSIVDELIAFGFIREIGLQKQRGAGRRAIGIEFAASSRQAIGLQIVQRMIQAVVTDLYATPLQTFNYHLPNTEPETIVKAIGGLVDQIKETPVVQKLVGIGVGVPAIINSAHDTVIASSHLGWNQIPIKQMLEASFSTEALFDNNVKLATLGELWHGIGQENSHFTYCSFGTGVGCGFIVGGQLIRGQFELAGELGHIVVDPGGPSCACGNTGCLEALVGLPAIYSRLSGKTGIPVEQWDVSMLAELSHARHPAIDAELSKVGRWIGQALAHIVTLLNPKYIICDGPLMIVADQLLPIVREEMWKHALSYAVKDVRLVRSALYPYTSAIGAAASVIAKFERREDPLEPMVF